MLAGSASFAVAELFAWRSGLNLQWHRARRFYAALAGAIACGMALDLARANPIRMLFLSALLNGVVAPPLLVLIMLIANNRRVMGDRTNGAWLNVLGWSATVVMALAALALLVV